jgi:cytochrome c biogenesis protein CcdA
MSQVRKRFLGAVLVVILVLTLAAQAAADDPAPTPTQKVCHRCADDVVVGDEEPVVHVLVFHDRLCEACLVVDDEVLNPLEQAHGDRLIVDRRDVEGSSENYSLLRTLERKHGMSRPEMPVIFIGEHALTGEDEIREELPALVDLYAATGGAPMPQLPAGPTPTARPTSVEDSPPVHLAYVYQPGCQACDRVRMELDRLQEAYPQLAIREINVREETALCEWLAQRAGVPESQRLIAPAVFVADEALVAGDLTIDALHAIVMRHADAGASPPWEGWDDADARESRQEEAASSIMTRFRRFGLPTIVFAGLVDGLNPCAFATLVFFISYLALMGREGRELLLAGSAFTLGVFLTYLGIGVGLLEIVQALPFLDAASRWIYGVTALLCLALAAGSIHDWWQARRGRAQAMRLTMPTRLRRRVNQAVRRGMDARAFVPVTFATGVAVSVIELACTGQVYLPTILFVVGIPELRGRAWLYLLLYNAMFVAPLLIVFVLVYFGTTSRQLGRLIHRHTATVKLSTAFLFVALAVWMATAMV